MGKSNHKTIYLHIGSMKTGTTFLQNIFCNNETILKSHGWLYPVSARDKNTCHHLLSADIVPTKKVFFLDDKLQKNPKQHWSDLMNEIKEFNGENVLISNELFFEDCVYHYLHFAAKIHQLHEIAKIKFVVYLREQYQYLRAYYVQDMLYGEKSHENFESFVNEKRISCDYFWVLKKIAALVGKENIILRPYEPAQWVKQCLLADFCESVGMKFYDQFSRELKPWQHDNVSLPLEVIPFVNRLIKQIDVPNKKKTLITLFKDVYAVRNEKSTRVASPSRNGSLPSDFDDSNTMLAKEFLSAANSNFFAKKSIELNVNAESLTVSFVKIIVSLRKELKKIHTLLDSTKSERIAQ